MNVDVMSDSFHAGLVCGVCITLLLVCIAAVLALAKGGAQ